MAQYWEDECWYMAQIKQVEKDESYTVVFQEYGNEEVVTVEQVKPLHFAYKKTMLDVAVRIADIFCTEEDVKNTNYLESLTMTVRGRYFGDTVGDKTIAEYGLTSKQKKKKKKQQEKAERLAQFDPEVYYRKSRQKPRKEWLQWEKNTAIDIHIPDYSMYTLDDKEWLQWEKNTAIDIHIPD